MSHCSTNRRVFTFGTVLLLSASTFGATYYVDASATTNGPGTLDDYSNAFNNLQDAINVAGSTLQNDEIHVAQGVYHRHATNRALSFTLPGNPTSIGTGASGTIQIRGGYAGLNAPQGVDPDTQDIDEFVTELSGEINNPSSKQDNTHRVVRANGSAIAPENTLLEGVTITGGSTLSSGLTIEQDRGAGLWNSDGASPRVVKCTFSANIAAHGAAMCNSDESSPEIVDCKFLSNGLLSEGAGILIEDGSSAKIVGCTFDRNQGDWGGGVMNLNDSSALIVDCLFTSNSAATNGAGVFIHQNSRATIINCRFYGNRADHAGGGVALRQNDVSGIETTLTNCLFVGNYAGDIGGGMRAGRDTKCVLTNCTFVANNCAAWEVPSDPPVILYNTGGGFAIGADNCNQPTRTSVMRGCIFHGNFYVSPATGAGTQIAIVGLAPGELDIYHSDVQDSDVNEDGVYVIQDTACGDGELEWNNRLDADPQFVRMPDGGNDGFGDDLSTPNVDESANDDYGDLRLLCGSLCIDAAVAADLPPDEGDLNGNQNITEPTPLDLDLSNRVIGSECDMGAYERETSFCQGDATGNGVIDVDDLLAVINGWGTCPSPPATCDGDVGLAPCGGNGEVDVDDLLIIINQWGHDCPTQATVNVGSLSSVQDCMDAASLRFTPFSPQWDYFVNRCIDALCAQEIIECDE